MTSGPIGPDLIEHGKGSSSGWKHIFERFETLADKSLKRRFRQAKIGFDLESNVGNSAYALKLLCPNLATIHCVDNSQSLSNEFLAALKGSAVQHSTTVQEFLAQPDIKPADVIMISALFDQPFLKREVLENLAKKTKPGGILLIYNPQFSFDDYNEVPLTEYFTKITGVSKPSVEIWQKTDSALKS